MKIIRLSRNQVRWVAVNNPIFDHKVVKTDEENKELVDSYIETGCPKLREQLILCNLHLVEHTVGRYLANWPETIRWKDDMVSVGLTTLILQVDKINTSTIAEFFRAKTVLHLKNQIEMALNDSRTSVSASLSTNYRRVRDGKPMASVPEISLDKLLENK